MSSCYVDNNNETLQHLLFQCPSAKFTVKEMEDLFFKNSAFSNTPIEHTLENNVLSQCTDRHLSVDKLIMWKA
jgi:hypothetical protein